MAIPAALTNRAVGALARTSAMDRLTHREHLLVGAITPASTILLVARRALASGAGTRRREGLETGLLLAAVLRAAIVRATLGGLGKGPICRNATRGDAAGFAASCTAAAGAKETAFHPDAEDSYTKQTRC